MHQHVIILVLFSLFLNQSKNEKVVFYSGFTMVLTFLILLIESNP